MKKDEEYEQLAKILSQSRYKSGKSQEYMANGIGVSKNTIINWEKGASRPDILQFRKWFTLLNLNPTPYYNQVFNQLISEEELLDSDEYVEIALNRIVENLSISQKRGLLYMLHGSHGSDPDSVIQMIVADMHCPIRDRINIARSIIDNYEIAERKNNLVGKDNIKPDMERLKNALFAAIDATVNDENSYSI